MAILVKTKTKNKLGVNYLLQVFCYIHTYRKKRANTLFQSCDKVEITTMNRKLESVQD